MELVMNFVSNNPGWTLLFIIFGTMGIAEIIKAIRGVPPESIKEPKDDAEE